MEKYLRLERARFGDRLDVRVQVAPEVLHGGRAGAVAAAAGGERGPPRRRAATRLRPGRDRRRRPRRRRRAARQRRRRRDERRAAARRSAGRGDGHRPRQRPRAPAVDASAPTTGSRWSRARTRGPRWCMTVPKFRPGCGRHERAGCASSPSTTSGRRCDDLARMLRASPAVRHVDVACERQEALQALADRDAIDAVFLDVRMPDLDGLELARVLGRFADPPALVFVSRLRGRGRRGVRAAGARLPDEAGAAAGSTRRWRVATRGGRGGPAGRGRLTS